ncbi:MAG: hypothetical protein K5931_02620 [Lachnospiraceae bacterium]|nr:hypothetical protein [Lachnospiraceae bacterium]
MQEMLKLISDRVEQLKKAIKKAGNEQKLFPDGQLRVSSSGDNIRYYNILKSGDVTGKYLSKKDMKQISLLAQKSYNKKFLSAAEKEVRLLETLLGKISDGGADKVYEELVYSRKILVTPYIQTDEMYVKEWKEKKYKKCCYRVEEKRYDTKAGEKVRSKSEAILADMFYEMKIPYRYEEELLLKNRQVRYPDFTLLKVKTREVYYLEHFGLLEDDEYRRHNLKKLDEYRDNDIYPGKNLLITYETKDSPLDIKGIRKMLKEVILS